MLIMMIDGRFNEYFNHFKQIQFRELSLQQAAELARRDPRNKKKQI
jgi:hypothetical protein